ncbi:MAG: BON domain-containing protein [Rubripirellula sp.]
MRRKYLGLAIAAVATLGPMQAWGGDREIAEQIIKRLKTNRDSGALKDFTLDMKVDSGVVLFRGSVSKDVQKGLVLATAKGIEGVARVVDEVKVTSQDAQVIKPQAQLAAVKKAPVTAVTKAPAKTEPVVAKAAPKATPKAAPKPTTATKKGGFSFRDALAAQRSTSAPAAKPAAMPIMPGKIMPAAAVEPTDDAGVVAAVVSALRAAKEAGNLKGFGVDVKSQNGVLQLSGRASSPAQRDTIIHIAENVPGVAGVREAIAIPTAAPNLPRLPEPPSLQEVSSPGLAPVAVDPVSRPARGYAASPVSAPVASPIMTTPYRTQGGPVPARAASIGAPVAGQPVPMAPYSAVGAPRYDSPNLPNYAWPGYAAHPNYAALTYPQQYSPSAWPYIGPFYPYPQVPLGWRKISLEWDDGWWFLDFTDR